MIIAHLRDLPIYGHIPFLSEISAFLASHELGTFAQGDYEIRGQDLYFRVLRYAPKDPSEVSLETHQQYIDIHILLEGIEVIPTASAEHLVPVTQYDPKTDMQLFTASTYVSEIVMQPQMWAVFFPGESHASKRYGEQNSAVKKIVFKIRKQEMI